MKKWNSWIKASGFFCLLSVLSVAPTAQAAGPEATALVDFQTWLAQEQATAQARMLLNISAPGTALGSVIASPSKSDPNYDFYWVRDGSLAMNTVLGLFERSSGQEQASYLQMLENWRAFSRANQLTNSPPGLGDPRYNVDGSVDTIPWGRPQNDGPALRALTFIRFANDLLKLGRIDYVTTSLYSNQTPTDAVIKADLDYVVEHWQDPCIDLWEEIRGQHFFTRAVQFTALQEGAALAELLGDSASADVYRQTADDIEQALNTHWSDQHGYFLETLESEAGSDHQKPSQLDVAVILATLAAQQPEGILSPLSDRILATATALEHAFAALYPINQDKSVGTAIGRYTEDYYVGGNPWFLTTSAFAELHYKVASILATRSSYYLTPLSAEFFASAVNGSEKAQFQADVDIAANSALKALAIKSLVSKGDGFLKRVQRHLGSDGSQSEQYLRDTGLMTSAFDLTWSYASFLNAGFAREATQP